MSNNSKKKNNTNFPAIMSDEPPSPPPLDGSSEEDDSQESEFRTPGMKLDVMSADPSPFTSPRKESTSKPPLENGRSSINIDEDEEDEVPKSHPDPSFKELEIGSQEEEEEWSVCHEVDDEGDNREPKLLNEKEFVVEDTSQVVPENETVVDDSPPLSQTRVIEGGDQGFATEDNNSPNPSQKETTKDGSPQAATTTTETEPVQDLPAIEAVEPNSSVQPAQEDDSFDEYDDFDNFQSCAIPITGCPEGNNISNPTMQSSIRAEEERKVLEQGGAQEDDDDFGDFASTDFERAPINSTVTDRQEEVPTGTENVEQFADFQDASLDFALFPTSVHTITTAGKRPSMESATALESKFDQLLASIIPLPSSPSSTEENASTTETECTKIDDLLTGVPDPRWNHVKDFEASCALCHKWQNSSLQQKYYEGLDVDTSTIMYTEKWGVIEVPRFATSMVDAPILKPQQLCSNATENHSEDDSIQRHNNNKRSSTTGILMSNSSSVMEESEAIIQRIPDISYMLSKTLVYPRAANPL